MPASISAAGPNCCAICTSCKEAHQKEADVLAWVLAVRVCYDDAQAWLAAHPRLQLHFLPTHCSHLNPVERIWLQLKDDLAASRVFGSIKLLLASVDRFFAAMTPEQALLWAAEEK